MGNRAIIATWNKDLQVYLHWNGGRDSVKAFLKYCKLRGFRSPETDPYGWARLCQVLGNFFGANGLSVGIEPYSEESYVDNGVYIIEDWEIIGRERFDGIEQRQYDMDEMLRAIDQAQPADQRLGEYLDSIEVDIEDVIVGDEIYMSNIDGRFVPYEVLGIATEGRYEGLPYVKRYKNEGAYTSNPNNYPHGDKCRIKLRK